MQGYIPTPGLIKRGNLWSYSPGLSPERVLISASAVAHCGIYSRSTSHLSWEWSLVKNSSPQHYNGLSALCAPRTGLLSHSRTHTKWHSTTSHHHWWIQRETDTWCFTPRQLRRVISGWNKMCSYHKWKFWFTIQYTFQRWGWMSREGRN